MIMENSDRHRVWTREQKRRILEEHQMGKTIRELASKYEVKEQRIEAICREMKMRKRLGW